MKKKFMIALALVLCIAIALPVAAVAAGFVPSVTYKGGPIVVDAFMMDAEGQLLDVNLYGGSCIVVTTVEEAREEKTDILQEERDLLIEVYEALEKGEMTLPLEEEHVIRDLVDISFKHANCRQINDHNNKHDLLNQDDVILGLTLKLGIEPETELAVLYYVNEEWVQIETVVNNGDGTVTCHFPEICPVAFVVLG